MSQFALFLLGPPRIEHESKLVRVNTRKAIALAAYLSVTAGKQSRESLVAMLWPELDRRRGLAALRSTLSALKKALDGKGLAVERELISLLPGEELWVDVARFHSALAACWSGSVASE